jgi:tetratricopeptide (TPR) repeat protein
MIVSNRRQGKVIICTEISTLKILLKIFFLAFFGIAAIFAQQSGEPSLIEQGEKLFLENKMEEAKPVLESAVRLYPTYEKLYLYLGTVYEILGEYEQGVTMLQRGTLYAKEYLDVMYFNIGNFLFKQEKKMLAEEMYSKALEENIHLSDVYLNRANTRVSLEKYSDALEDYSVYLNLRPTTDQRGNIEKVMEILNRMVEEELSELRAEEDRMKAEEARQQALLNDVLNSLERASEGTKNISAESEGIEQTDEESDIVE